MSGIIAIVGATGAVGTELLKLIDQRDLQHQELRLFASARTAGQVLDFRGSKLVLEELQADSFQDTDLAFFSAGSAIAKKWAPIAAESDTLVIDHSSAFRMDAAVPLIVPEVNLNSYRGQKIIANPNCTAILLVMVLAPIHRQFGIQRAIISTYQAASGVGRVAMEEFLEQTRNAINGKPVAASAFPAPLGFNLIPQCDSFLDNAFTGEEMKVARETRKILDVEDLQISCTAVRVPILRVHSESVCLELKSPFELQAIRSLLDQSPGLRLLDHPAFGGYPMPILATGKDRIIVGRLRKDPIFENGLSLFLSGDQIRKGAALNAIQIAEALAGVKS